MTNYKCGACSKLWTKICPYRTRVKETERKATDAACASFDRERDPSMLKARGLEAFK